MESIEISRSILSLFCSDNCSSGPNCGLIKHADAILRKEIKGTPISNEIFTEILKCPFEHECSGDNHSNPTILFHDIVAYLKEIDIEFWFVFVMLFHVLVDSIWHSVP
ncbi:hypothetical protein C496_23538 [Natronorubrum tibetense GA33]|uniref:Uncharacterized protein n=1 Tax=Natronorubrum tibetense GA33 TaxID=1114856 RepID=L9VDR6_9EURY|nr:hypothetical protein C496_23538 [Natronorubrum tibetense GA33]